MSGCLSSPFAQDRDRLVRAPGADGRFGAEAVLPRGHFEGAAGPPADRQGDRAGLDRRGGAAHRRIVDGDERPGRPVELLAGDRECRVAGDDEVDLFVPAGAAAELVVILDELASGGVRDVGVHAEGVDAEQVAQRLPAQLGRKAERQLLGVRQVRDREAGVRTGLTRPASWDASPATTDPSAGRRVLLAKEREQRLGGAREDARLGAHRVEVAQDLEALDAARPSRVPCSTSGPIAQRLRKVTPPPAIAACLADSMRPISMTTLRRSGRTPRARRCSSTTDRTPAPCCCTICGSATQLVERHAARALAQGCDGLQTRTISSRASGSTTSSGRGVTAPTAPISNSRASTRSTTACVSSTCSEIAHAGVAPP